MPRNESVAYLLEEPRRQKSIVTSVCIRPLAQIVAGPDEFVSFAHHDPGRLVIEMEVTLHAGRNLDR